MSFSYDEKIDCEIEYSIIINEGENAYLSARGFSDKKNRANERSNILEIINEFHDERRWPFCRLRQQGRRLSIDTCLDVDLSGGVHFELLDDLLREFMSSTYDFWLHIVAKGL